MSIENIKKVRISLAEAAKASFAGPEQTLIAVSKQQPREKILGAINAGIMDFGENRVQEAMEKWLDLKSESPEIRLHLIGPLQTNKVKEAVSLFDVIHTVDRVKLADALLEEMQKQEKKLPCFIQVNTGEEPQKSGVLPQEADALIEHCKAIGMNIIGLMCVPPVDSLPAPHFALLKKIAARHRLLHLSMGMSSDYETAIRMGATHVRIGTALFGERKD